MKDFGKGAIIGLAAVGVGMLGVYAVEAATKKTMSKWAAVGVSLGAGALVGGAGFLAFK